MNCFEWQSRSSDFLDGNLMGSLKADADQHLESCKDCSERHQHYRLILTSIASQPRTSLPPTLRKSPLSAILPAADVRRTTRSRWERIPWLFRTTIEGTAIVLLILLGISAGPKLRSFYEQRIERSLNEFSDSFSTADLTDGTESAPVPLARGKNTAEPVDPSAGDEFSGEDEGGENDEVTSEANADESLRVGSSEIWRFNLKTDSPHEIRPRIVQALMDLKVPPSTPGFGGIEAPGGIQFDLLVNKSVILELKRQLQKVAPKAPAGKVEGLTLDTFTWYKNKSKRKIPDGKARVVIWLSQI